MQKKLDSYFSVTRQHKPRSCFIYDPSQRRATFENEPGEDDCFLHTVLDVSLYLRSTPSSIQEKEFPLLSSSASIPLLISNLQKAVRRGDPSIAVPTALLLLQRDPMKLLRRLPIVYIEDVCLMDSYSLLVWWMMAGEAYVLTSVDIECILQCVLQLCTHMHAYEADRSPRDHSLLPSLVKQGSDAVLAVYYRSRYGGMKGDMWMLEAAVEYYLEHPCEIVPAEFPPLDPSWFQVPMEILPQAVDFHPFPKILATIATKTQLEERVIKEFIWFVDSAINVRKPATLDQSMEYAEKEEWPWIESVLARLRRSILQR